MSERVLCKLPVIPVNLACKQGTSLKANPVQDLVFMFRTCPRTVLEHYEQFLGMLLMAVKDYFLLELCKNTV